MVYISSWQEYQEAAEALYEKSPNTVSLLNYCTDAGDDGNQDSILREVETVDGWGGQAGAQNYG